MFNVCLISMEPRHNGGFHFVTRLLYIFGKFQICLHGKKQGNILPVFCIVNKQKAHKLNSSGHTFQYLVIHDYYTDTKS